MPSAAEMIEAGSVRAEFAHQRDRYAHTISVLRSGVWLPVLASVESDADTDWPESPPLQSLHVEDRAEGRVVLLVGMAGSSHWSAAVQADTARRTITLDLACRVRNLSEAGPIASGYRSLVAAEWQELIAVTASASTVMELTSTGVRLTRSDFRTTSAEQRTGSATVTWCYTFSAL